MRGRMNLSVMTILAIIAWDDMICMVGLRYRRWLASVNLLKFMVKMNSMKSIYVGAVLGYGVWVTYNKWVKSCTTIGGNRWE